MNCNSRKEVRQLLIENVLHRKLVAMQSLSAYTCCARLGPQNQRIECTSVTTHTLTYGNDVFAKTRNVTVLDVQAGSKGTTHVWPPGSGNRINLVRCQTSFSVQTISPVASGSLSAKIRFRLLLGYKAWLRMLRCINPTSNWQRISNETSGKWLIRSL